MRPTLELDVQHTGTLGGQRKSFTIDLSDAAAQAHIMGVLTDLYSDPIEAAIREPAVNAWDSHVAKGQTRPIEVTLPTDLDPTFTVQDFGVGMSGEQLLDDYSKYGYSSKRENDEEAGMLGLGCKAPLTYTSQFTVVSVKDGVRSTMLVSRGTDGVGGLEIIEQRKVKQPNGVLVTIPVASDMEKFVSKAMRIFGFWSPGSILVDGKPPEHHMEHEDAKQLDPDIVLTPRLGQDYVVMGNVAYPAGSRISGEYQGNAIVRVPVGAVNFPPSREALHYTPRTEDVLAIARSFVFESVQRIAQADVEAQDTAPEAIRAMKKWRNLHRKVELTYRGRDFVSHIGMQNWGYAYNPQNDTSSRFSETSSFPLEWFLERKHVILVLGYDKKSFSRVHKNKLRAFFKDEDGNYPNLSLYIGNKLPDAFWLADADVVQWDDVQKVKVAPSDAPPKQAKRKTRFEMVNNEGQVLWEEEPDLSGKVVVVSGEGMYGHGPQVKRALPNDKVVVLHPNRVDKFFREHKGAIDFQDAIKIAAERFARRLTTVEAEVLLSGGNLSSQFADLKASDVKDPTIAKYMATIDAVKKNGLRKQYHSLNSFLGFGRPMRLDTSKGENFHQYIQSRYPLLDHVSWRVPTKEVLDYVNAMYLTRQERAA